MAGTVVSTETTFGHVKKIKLAWTSSAGGAADGTTTNYFTGKVLHLVTVPDGVAAPTDNYDITLVDSDGVDVLAGGGANRSTSATQHVVSASLGAVVASKLTLGVTNAGDTKQGTLYLFIQ